MIYEHQMLIIFQLLRKIVKNMYAMHRAIRVMLNNFIIHVLHVHNNFLNFLSKLKNNMTMVSTPFIFLVIFKDITKS